MYAFYFWIVLSAQLILEACGTRVIYPYPDFTLCGTHLL